MEIIASIVSFVFWQYFIWKPLESICKNMICYLQSFTEMKKRLEQSWFDYFEMKFFQRKIVPPYGERVQCFDFSCLPPLSINSMHRFLESMIDWTASPFLVLELLAIRYRPRGSCIPPLTNSTHISICLHTHVHRPTGLCYYSYQYKKHTRTDSVCVLCCCCFFIFQIIFIFYYYYQ